MKKVVLFIACMLALAMVFSGCGTETNPSDVESTVDTRKSSHTKSQASSQAGSATEGLASDVEGSQGSRSEADVPAGDGGAYEENGFTLKTATLAAAPEGLGGSPVETDIVFLLNNVTDGSVTMTSDRGDLLIFSAEYAVDSAVSGTLKLVVTDESGTAYIRENQTEFARSGDNTFEALIKTDGALGGTYTVQWFIDDLLACETECTI